MKIKVFYPTKDGKIVLDKNQLEALLTEAYEEGHKDGYNEALAANPPYRCPYPYIPTINEPSITPSPYTPSITWCSQTPENYIYNQKEGSLTAESECNCSNTIKCMKCKGE